MEIEGFDLTLENVDLFVITCVDPQYPAKSLAVTDKDELNGRISGIDVNYDGDHVQQSEGFSQVFLRYDGLGGFSIIEKENVKKNLPEGIIQLAYNENTVVMGLPGDIYAFHKYGFAFGKSDVAPHEKAEKILIELIKMSGINKEGISVVAMKHSDCGQFAKTAALADEYRKAAEENIESYLELEGKEKDSAEEHFIKMLVDKAGLPEKNIYVKRPDYKPREGGSMIEKAMENTH